MVGVWLLVGVCDGVIVFDGVFDGVGVTLSPVLGVCVGVIVFDGVWLGV